MFNMSPAKAFKRTRLLTFILSVLGFILSASAVYVEYRKENEKDYKAFCDINSSISCSKVFTSKYGKGFGILGTILGEENPLVLPNGVYGLVLYSILIVLGEIKSIAAARMQKFLAFSSNFMSLYLAYILYFILKDFCVVCVSTYVINFLITVSCFVRTSYLNNIKNKKKSSKKKA